MSTILERIENAVQRRKPLTASNFGLKIRWMDTPGCEDWYIASFGGWRNEYQPLAVGHVGERPIIVRAPYNFPIDFESAKSWFETHDVWWNKDIVPVEGNPTQYRFGFQTRVSDPRDIIHDSGSNSDVIRLDNFGIYITKEKFIIDKVKNEKTGRMNAVYGKFYALHPQCWEKFGEEQNRIDGRRFYSRDKIKMDYGVWYLASNGQPLDIEDGDLAEFARLFQPNPKSK